MGSQLKRRLVTIPAVIAGFVLSTLLLPVLVVVALAADLLTGRVRLPISRLVAFGWWYLLSETVGLAFLATSWLLTLGRPSARSRQTYRIQSAWAAALGGALRVVFGVRFEFEAEQAALGEGPYVVMMRHASIVDTLLPASLIAGPYGTRLRYVLKAELLADPCLDVAGNRLPNVFVRRGRAGADIPAVSALAEDLGSDEAVLLYPEGTRFTAAKLARFRASPNPRLSGVAATLTHTLPPRPGGAVGLIRAGHDVVFLAHRGLEGLAGIKDLTSGALIGTKVRAEAWRVAAADIDLERVEAWLVEQWQRVDRWVAAEAAGAET